MRFEAIATVATEDLKLSKDDEALLLSVLEGGMENLRQWTQAGYALHRSLCLSVVPQSVECTSVSY